MTNEEAIKYLERIDVLYSNDFKPSMTWCDHKAIAKAIESLRTKKPKCKWLKTKRNVMGEGYMWFCSKCNYEVYQDSSRPYPSENFCPNCGADMRGDIK